MKAIFDFWKMNRKAIGTMLGSALLIALKMDWVSPDQAIAWGAGIAGITGAGMVERNRNPQQIKND